MSKPKFKVGDAVTVRTSKEAVWAHEAMPDYVPAPGIVGTVEEVEPLGGWIRWTGEHGCHADRTWVPFDYVERFSEQVVIYRRGRSVFAKDLTTHRIAEAKCSPEDEFDFLRGAALALDRLFDREEPKPEKPKFYTGKVVCVESAHPCFWTVGRVYDVCDGFIQDDANGFRGGAKSPADISRLTDPCTKFIALVE
jgi:hypothetical protein